MSHYRIGTVDLPPRTTFERYFEALGTLELTSLVGASVKTSTLNRWREQTKPRSLILHAPWVITHRKNPSGVATRTTDAASGEFRDTPLVRDAVAELASAAEACDAHGVIFTSPTLFSPSQHHRDRLKAFFGTVASQEVFGDRARIWIPDPLWEPVSAVRFANELGVQCAIDPLVKDHEYRPGVFHQLEADAVYFRILGMGRAGLMRQQDMDELLELVSTYQDATVMFGSAERWKDAKNFQRHMAEMLPEALASDEEPAESEQD